MLSITYLSVYCLLPLPVVISGNLLNNAYATNGKKYLVDWSKLTSLIVDTPLKGTFQLISFIVVSPNIDSNVFTFDLNKLHLKEPSLTSLTLIVPSKIGMLSAYTSHLKRPENLLDLLDILA